MQKDDREILNLLSKDESRNEGFLMLVNKYQQKLYHHIRRLVISHDDADDVLQNTFIKAWTGIGGFRGDSQLFTWLYRIATNEALSFLKRSKKDRYLPLERISETAPAGMMTGPSGEEISLQLMHAVKKLPPKQQAVFNMKYYDDLKYEEISGIMKTSVGALKASYHHAIKKIENELGGI